MNKSAQRRRKHCAPAVGCTLGVYGHLGDKPTGRQTTGRQSNWAIANWATHFGQLGDNIGRVIKDVNVGKIFEIISFIYIIVV